MYNHEPSDYNCPFCKLIRGEDGYWNRQEDIIYENEDILVFISPKWWPKNPGGVIVISRNHVENIYDIPDDLLGKLYIVAKRIALAMKQSYSCDGISFRQHNEPAGNQDVWHFHIHILPRWENDNLYINHKKSRHFGLESRQPYAEKLKIFFK
ncbi:HIT family protein [Candidatus Beckwithbacteria bacterium]|nr:HIT family protein [Candidatus Beckwithbacteria bacterium]